MQIDEITTCAFFFIHNWRRMRRIIVYGSVTRYGPRKWLKREETRLRRLNPISTVSDALCLFSGEMKFVAKKGRFLWEKKERDRRKIGEDTRGVKQSHWRPAFFAGVEEESPSGRCVCFSDEACYVKGWGGGGQPGIPNTVFHRS